MQIDCWHFLSSRTSDTCQSWQQIFCESTLNYCPRSLTSTVGFTSPLQFSAISALAISFVWGYLAESRFFSFKRWECMLASCSMNSWKTMHWFECHYTYGHWQRVVALQELDSELEKALATLKAEQDQALGDVDSKVSSRWDGSPFLYLKQSHFTKASLGRNDFCLKQGGCNYISHFWLVHWTAKVDCNHLIDEMKVHMWTSLVFRRLTRSAQLLVQGVDIPCLVSWLVISGTDLHSFSSSANSYSSSINKLVMAGQ